MLFLKRKFRIDTNVRRTVAVLMASCGCWALFRFARNFKLFVYDFFYPSIILKKLDYSFLYKELKSFGFDEDEIQSLLFFPEAVQWAVEKVEKEYNYIANGKNYRKPFFKPDFYYSCRRFQIFIFICFACIFCIMWIFVLPIIANH